MPSISIFECAATGRGVEIHHTDGKEALLPIGWAEVTLRTRTPNPERRMILRAMELITNATLSQWPPEARNDGTQRTLLERRVSAEYAAVLAATPEFLEHVATGYISMEEPEGDGAIQKIADLAGLSFGADLTDEKGAADDDTPASPTTPEPAPKA
jgi:hypothetical protein